MIQENCIESMRALLTDALSPSLLKIEDESYQHIGHGGVPDGQGHYYVQIVSEQFRGLPLVTRHRMVYQCLLDLMTTRIHALRIDAKAPDEIN